MAKAKKPALIKPVKAKDGYWEVTATVRITTWFYSHSEAIAFAEAYNLLLQVARDGTPVQHFKYGTGVITGTDEYYVSVRFATAVKNFTLRDALRYLRHVS